MSHMRLDKKVSFGNAVTSKRLFQFNPFQKEYFIPEKFQIGQLVFLNILLT